MIIGLDVSTAIVGITALTDDGVLLKISHVDLRKLDADDLCAKCEVVTEELESYLGLMGERQETYVFIEAAAKRIVAKSSANTLFKLARFNGMVSYAAYKVFACPSNVVEVAPSTARAKVGWKKPTIPKGTKSHVRKGIIKESVIDLVLQDHSSEDLGFVKTKHDNWQVWCGDRADSYVIAKYGHLSLS